MAETLKVPEAAKRLGISRNSLYEAIKRKEIPVIRIGQAIRISTRWLDHQIDKASGETA
jgi:excisionase family DNA binding protein